MQRDQLKAERLQHVLDAVRSIAGICRLAQIHEHTGMSRSQLDGLLRKLRERGDIIHDPKLGWKVTVPGDMSPPREAAPREAAPREAAE